MSGVNTSNDLEVRDFSNRGPGGDGAAKHYGEALLAAAQRDHRIVCLTADLTLSTETDLFRDGLPERFQQVGIAEANMIGLAGGMARCGDVPFVHSFCVFASRRCYDQIAMQVAYPRLNVKIVGVLPGLTTVLGVSHQAIDDIALMRALPNMTVIEPSGPDQIRAVVDAVARHDGPIYLRLKRADGSEGPVREHTPFAIGKMRILREGAHGAIVACGLMVDNALRAARLLSTEGLEITVVDMATIKPVDPALAELGRRLPVVLTAENHSIVGGLGSAVAELFAESGATARFRRVGVMDVFAEGGTTGYLFEKYGLSAEALAAAFRATAKEAGS